MSQRRDGRVVYDRVDPKGLRPLVDWTLQPTASGGTRLALEHSGFRPEDPQASAGAEHGWRVMTGKLRELLASV